VPRRLDGTTARAGAAWAAPEGAAAAARAGAAVLGGAVVADAAVAGPMVVGAAAAGALAGGAGAAAAAAGGGRGGGRGRGRLPYGPRGFEHILLADAAADPRAGHGREVHAVFGCELAHERGDVGAVGRRQRRHGGRRGGSCGGRRFRGLWRRR